MKLTHSYLLIAVYSAMGFSAFAQAQEAVSQPATQEASNIPVYQDGHFYLGGRMGWAAFQGACGSSALDCNDDPFGYGVYGGYQYTPWFALEGGLTAYGEPDARYESGSVSSEVQGGEMAAKLTYPLTDRLGLYSRLGAAYQDIDKTSSNIDGTIHSYEWNAFASIGLDYRLSQRWSLRGEYQFVDGIGNSDVQQADMHFTSLGVTYHFGQEPVVVPAPQAAPVPQPAKPQYVVVVKPMTFSGDALFDTSSATLKDTQALDKMIGEFAQYPKGNIQVIGHTDATGPDAFNQALSEKRAQAVAAHLQSKGVGTSRLQVSGKGETEPVATNSTVEGRAKNRRVEIKFETQVEETQVVTDSTAPTEQQGNK